MQQEEAAIILEELRAAYPDKFASVNRVFSHIHRGDVIFIASGCGEPQYLVQSLIEYVESHPKGFFDAEVLHLWSLGLAPYADDKFKRNFRHNSFFLGDSTRNAVNRGVADYSPVSLSQIPRLFKRGIIKIDVALIQVSLPDRHGYVSLGVSVDMVKAATDMAAIVIAQPNRFMPRVHGDSFIHVSEIDYIMPFDEPLLEYRRGVGEEDSEVVAAIGRYVARLVQDGDTIQVGYGNVPNAVMVNLSERRHLGVHTELLSDGIVELMKAGVVDNTRKTIDRGKTVATFCMGRRETYEYLDDNPAVDFRPVDYTNNPLVIAQQENMVAINSALEIDLTGQATSESIGGQFYSGVGGHYDFMRGALLAPNGKTILAVPSTAAGGEVSRIVPSISEGAGVTLNRGDVNYVVTEYGIAYLHGKNVRERAMDLIQIAHPRFRPWLIQEAKKRMLIYKDQAFIPGRRGEYPEEMETRRTTRGGLEIVLRPVKISDEPLVKDFFYSLSDQSLYRRFMSVRKDMPHERLQEFVVIDYTKEIVILALVQHHETEEVVGLGQYGIDESAHTAEVAVAVKDEYHNHGIGTELLSYLTLLAKRYGLLGFTAEVLVENKPMLHLFEKMGFDLEKRIAEDVYELKMLFREVPQRER
ncbi:MAG: GNAT family N-acetyltransferase [Dehalococcoidia bacterium]|jgi:acyl-CoA hydrolase/GNAT superfamily N-acetyltransferase|nr:GNAT family N-acetyltransferase [Dehalococcoidia bacterium]